jgi:hypothetical protein
MVAPWDEVSATLKPNFALTGDQAVAQVLPTTESISEQVLRAFGASLAAGLPTTSTTSTSTVGGASPGTTTTTEKAPGTAPTIANTLPSGVALPSGTTQNATLGLDPVEKYKAANYLLQEVQLLNQEIENAARRSCYVPYVVKLKLAVMNFRPRLPYSAHTHVGFFYNGALASQTRPMVTGRRTPAPSPELAPECKIGQINPVVIPLLVADDVQVALKSRAAEAASQVALGLSALVGGTGIAANANSLQASLTAISNHDLSSTLTIGRESESSLYALITPNNQASDQAALVSQTYDVAVLLLIPRYYFGGVSDPQSPTISVSTYSEYRHATTGEVLKNDSTDLLVKEADRIIPPHLTADGLGVWRTMSSMERVEEAKRLAAAVKVGSSDLFLDEVECKSAHASDFKLCKGVKPYLDGYFAPSLWTAMGTFLDYEPEKLSLFQALLPAPIKVPTQEVLLSDDGTHPIQAVLGGVSARSTAKLAAFLKVTPFDTETWKDESPVVIPAQGLSLDATAHTLTLTFPSLKKLNIGCLSPTDIPPKPKDAAKTAPAPAAGSPEKPKDPACPPRAADAGSDARPNGIVLQLIGCDDTKQICPTLTDTDADWLRKKVDHLAKLKGLLEKDVQDAKEKEKNFEEAKADAEKYKNESAAHAYALAADQAGREWSHAEPAREAAEREIPLLDDAIKRVLGELDAAHAEAKHEPARTFTKNNSKQQALLGTGRATSLARAAAITAASAANVDNYLFDHAAIGVALIPSQQSTDPAKVSLTNTGQVIQLDSAGGGQIVVTVGATPSTDNVGISVTGADLKSIVDSTGAATPFKAKQGFVLSQAGIYTLSLSNLNETRSVVVTAQALKGDAADGQALTQTYQPIAPRPGKDATTH